MLSIIIFTLSLVLARTTVSCGYRAGLVDHPGARKQHFGAVPLTGGIAIFLTILVGTLLLSIPPYSSQMMIIAFGVFLVGLFDDVQHINPWLRLLIQLAAGAALATYGGITIHKVGDLLAIGNIPLLLLATPLTALAVAGLSNAYNMIDGIDGLAASTAAIPLLTLYLLGIQAAHPMANSVLLILIPTCVFLLFNLGPNNRLLPKMFLGDGGSITLGFLVTASLVYFSQGEGALIKPVTALWLVTVPLMSMLSTMLIRARHQRGLMEADRSHLHHTLMDTGLSDRGTLALLVLGAISSSAIGLALERAPDYLSLLCYFLGFTAHCIFMIKRETTRRWVRP